LNVSGNLLEFDDRQMLAAGVVADYEDNLLAGITVDGRYRRCTRSAGWPVWPHFDARHFLCGGAVVVHFVGRSADEKLVRPMLIVPVEMEGQFSPHVAASQWDDDSGCALILERADESLDHSDATILSNGAKSRLDAFAFAPSFETVTPELRALVADDVLGFALGVQAAEEGANLDGRDRGVWP